ncbi:ADP-ribosylglycohydrolase family protein [Desulforhopalus sp. 52FAK]
MKKTISFQERVEGALFGAFIGDALAMPVHWYYDTQALRRDYGKVDNYLKPRNPHPDSILWRSSYNPPNKSADILHDQAQYWGKREIHYHQFLKAGENTLNVKLVRELLVLLEQDGSYLAESWLDRMISFLTTQGNHEDTYMEEYLRHFFTNYGKGITPMECGRSDEHHIGGFSLMLPMLVAYAETPEYAKKIALDHLALTHGGSIMNRWGGFIASTLLNLLQGDTLQESMKKSSGDCDITLDYEGLESLQDYPDDTVVGKHFSSACYVEQAVPATFFLALKYCASPEESLIVNTMCGGDNVGRGAILGALLGALHGVECWPVRWREGLLHPPPLVQLEFR